MRRRLNVPWQLNLWYRSWPAQFALNFLLSSWILFYHFCISCIRRSGTIIKQRPMMAVMFCFHFEEEDIDITSLCAIVNGSHDLKRRTLHGNYTKGNFGEKPHPSPPVITGQCEEVYGKRKWHLAQEPLFGQRLIMTVRCVDTQAIFTSFDRKSSLKRTKIARLQRRETPPEGRKAGIFPDMKSADKRTNLPILSGEFQVVSRDCPFSNWNRNK